MQGVRRRNLLGWLLAFPMCRQLMGSPLAAHSLADEPSEGRLALQFTRFVNTMEARYKAKHERYADLANLVDADRLKWHPRSSAEMRDLVNRLGHGSQCPLPGWECRLDLGQRETTYLFRLWENRAGNGLALASDHSGRIFVGKAPNGALLLASASSVAEMSTIGLLPLERSPLAPYSYPPIERSLLHRAAFAFTGALSCTCQDNPSPKCANIGQNTCHWCCFGSCADCCGAYSEGCVCCDCDFPPHQTC